MFTVKDLMILAGIFLVFAGIVELLYVITLKSALKKLDSVDMPKIIVVNTTREINRPAKKEVVDIDLGIKKVDKVRFGDEP